MRNFRAKFTEMAADAAASTAVKTPRAHGDLARVAIANSPSSPLSLPWASDLPLLLQLLFSGGSLGSPVPEVAAIVGDEREEGGVIL